MFTENDMKSFIEIFCWLMLKNIKIFTCKGSKFRHSNLICFQIIVKYFDS